MYAFVTEESARYSIRKLCHTLGVSRSAYYASKQRPKSRRQRVNKALLTHIQIAFHVHQKRYGSPRITQELKSHGVVCSENRVARLMQRAQLQATMKKAFIRTTDSSHGLPLVSDLVQQEFTASRPNELWLSDITYIRSREGWLYLAAILDVYSRKIVGWAIQHRQDEKLIHEVLDMAIDSRNPGAGLIFHSDRGSQYAATGVRMRLKYEGISQSMGRVGNCYDNAMMESFFSTLKRELLLNEPGFTSRKEARKAVSNYIDNYYNKLRIHSSIGNMSPVQYEQSNLPT